MRRLAIVIVVALLAGVGSWFFGSGILPAVVIALGVGGIALVLRLVVVSSGARDWPPPPPTSNDGTRRESSDLSWAIRARGGKVDDRIVERIRRIATDRLAARQLDFDNPAHAPAIERILGTSTFDVLSKPGSHAVRVSDVLGMLDILDRIRERPADNARTTPDYPTKPRPETAAQPTTTQQTPRAKKNP